LRISKVRKKREEDPVEFQLRFWRTCRMLHFIACRVLGGPEWAQEAVENCWYTASQGPPHFEYESEFRSWLLRVLIDEALALRHEHQQERVSREAVPAEAFQPEAMRNIERNLSTHGHSQFDLGPFIPME
jgi:DNA-directed RNA polymerase specialized sigma24 family protein